MFKSLLRASLLLAPAVTAIAATPSADLDELHQRQFRYARAMMQLNQIEGFERGPSIDALLRQEREAKAKRAEQGWRAAADARTQLMDAFAQAVERVATEQRAKRTMSRQWRIDEPYPSHWSVSGNETAAADCARAIEHPLGQPLRIEMIRGGVAWVRVVAPKKGHWAYDTVISEFDTKLSVYRDCRDTGGDPVRESDDALGLGSAVGLDAEAEGQTWMIKIEHKGGLGSVAIAKGVPAGTVSGRVTRASDGTPIPGVYVRSTSEGTGGVWSGYTNAQGNYQLEVMEDGEFYLEDLQDRYGRYPEELYDLVNYMIVKSILRDLGSFKAVLSGDYLTFYFNKEGDLISLMNALPLELKARRELLRLRIFIPEFSLKKFIGYLNNLSLTLN